VAGESRRRGSGERQIFGADLGTAAQDHRALDGVCQLADIPRPWMLHQEIHRLGGDPTHGLLRLRGVGRDKVPREQRQVLSTLA